MKSSDLRRQTVTAEVYNILRQKIIDGEYCGGQPLRQELIATELDVSRIPVREALVQLEGEGLVQIKPHRGAVVTKLMIDDARDIFEARNLLEPVLVQAAVAVATDVDIVNVEAAYQRYESGLKRKEASAVLSRYNWAFQNALCEPARRPRTLAIVASLHASADRYLRLQMNLTMAQVAAAKEHREIFETYVWRDSEEIARLVSEHIRQTESDVFKCIQRLQGERGGVPKARRHISSAK